MDYNNKTLKSGDSQNIENQNLENLWVLEKHMNLELWYIEKHKPWELE